MSFISSRKWKRACNSSLAHKNSCHLFMGSLISAPSCGAAVQHGKACSVRLSVSTTPGKQANTGHILIEFWLRLHTNDTAPNSAPMNIDNSSSILESTERCSSITTGGETRHNQHLWFWCMTCMSHSKCGVQVLESIIQCSVLRWWQTAIKCILLPA